MPSPRDLSLPPELRLSPGERLIWASPSSGTHGFPQWAWSLGVLVFLFGGMPFMGLAAVLGAQGGLGVLWGLVGTLPGLLVVAVPLLAWLVPRLRTTHFLTSRRLVRRKLLGGIAEMPLEGVRSVERVVVQYRTRYGVTELVTDRVRFDGPAGSFELGPSKDIGRVEDLIENGVLTRWVDLSALPSLDGAPAPAETSEAFFVCATTRSGGDLYGPLFVGPRVIVRVTEELPSHLLGRLYTRLAAAVEGSDAEAMLLEILKVSSTGHFIELPRRGTTVDSKGGALSLRGEAGQSFDVRLTPGDGERLARYLARPVPELPPISLSGQLAGRSAPPSGAPGSPAAAPSAPASTPSAADAAPVPARAPDLSDPTASESAAKTIHLWRLSGPQRTELAAALKSDQRLLFAPPRWLAEHRALVLLACVAPVATAVAWAGHFGDPCSPRQDPAWIAIYALGLVPLAFVIAGATLARLRARSLPFPAGLYVLPKDVVVARSAALRIVPLAQVAAIGAGRALPLSQAAELTLWIEGEPAESAFVPKTEIEALVARLEAAQKEAATLDAKRDPLRELKRSDVIEKASSARPPSGTGPAIGIAIGLAVALAVPIYLLRELSGDLASLAAAGSDVDALACYADAGGAQADVVRRVRIPHAAYEAAHAAGTVDALGGFLDAYPDAADAPAARAEREALAWSSASRDVWSLTAFIAGYPDSPHVAEARAMLPGLALENARSADDCATYANVVRSYPGTPEAEEATRLRHARYEGALASLTARGGQARTLEFFRQLFAHLEAHEEAEVLVRFRAPSASTLSALDELLARQNGPGVEPIAPAFTASRGRTRETIVYDRLRDAFAEVAPRDVLPLDHGMRLPEVLTEQQIAERLAAESDFGASTEELEALAARLHEDNDPPVLGPEIRIDYEVVPTGDLFVLETRPLLGDPLFGGVGAELPPDRRFAGFRVDFDVQMRLPAPEGGVAPAPVTLRVSVAPPETLPLGTPTERSTAEVYELLATAAFDRLSAELSRAFFGG